MDLHPVIEAQLAGKTVRYADLVRFDFKGGEVRLFQGRGRLTDGNGEVWLGIGRAGRMSGLTAGPGGAAAELELQLAGDERMGRYFKEDTEASSGQLATRYLQFFEVRQFDEEGNWVEWQPIGGPLELFVGVMGPLQSDREPVTDPVTGGSASRVLTVKVINLFYNRRKPAHGYWSHRDQLARTGGTDNMFQETSRMASATVRWPAQLV